MSFVYPIPCIFKPRVRDKDPRTNKITFKDLEKLIKYLTLKYCLYLEEELGSMDSLTQSLYNFEKRRCLEEIL